MSIFTVVKFGHKLSQLSSKCSRIISITDTRNFFVGHCLKSDRLYTQKHEWITLDTTKAIGTIGITDFAQEALGDVVYVELPEIGIHLDSGGTAGTIESVKAASDVYAPVSGEVIERNTEIETKPHLVNKSCYDEGWLYKLKLKNVIELENLMDEQGYEKFRTHNQDINDV